MVHQLFFRFRYEKRPTRIVHDGPMTFREFKRHDRLVQRMGCHAQEVPLPSRLQSELVYVDEQTGEPLADDMTILRTGMTIVVHRRPSVAYRIAPVMLVTNGRARLGPPRHLETPDILVDDAPRASDRVYVYGKK